MEFSHVLIVSAVIATLLWVADPTQKITGLFKENAQRRDVATGKELEDKIGEGCLYSLVIVLYHVPAFLFPRIALPAIALYAFTHDVGWMIPHAVAILTSFLHWTLPFQRAMATEHTSSKRYILRAIYFGIPTAYLWLLVSSAFHTSS